MKTFKGSVLAIIVGFTVGFTGAAALNAESTKQIIVDQLTQNEIPTVTVPINEVTTTQVWNEPTRETYGNLELFGKVFDRIRKDHVDEHTDEELIKNAIKGMIEGLDKHSTFLDKEQFNHLKEQTVGEFVGIGAEVEYLKDEKLIKAVPYEDSPATKAGMEAGDIIIKIDGVDVKTLTFMNAIKKLRGKKGTKVNVEVVRDGVNTPVKLSITRDRIEIKVVKSRLIDDKIMYLRLTAFDGHSTRDMKRALVKMQKEAKEKNVSVRGLIIDLRRNPGGLLSEAISICDMFLDDGIIVYTKIKGGITEMKENATIGQEIPKNMNIVVLVNAWSASAAEIVSACLQDNNRATVAGVQSYGKGSVQTIIPMDYGTALKLTTAKYYTASGKTIHGVGVTPDVKIDLKKGEKIKDGVNDTQIKKAIEILIQKSATE